MTNREMLWRLLSEGRIELRPAALLESKPAGLPAGFRFERVEAMMLGLAIGDALGITTEGLKMPMLYFRPARSLQPTTRTPSRRKVSLPP